MTNNKGFSLIEVMIVVGIIGILSLMGYPLYKNYIIQVKVTEVITVANHYLNGLRIEWSENPELIKKDPNNNRRYRPLEDELGKELERYNWVRYVENESYTMQDNVYLISLAIFVDGEKLGIDPSVYGDQSPEESYFTVALALPEGNLPFKYKEYNDYGQESVRSTMIPTKFCGMGSAEANTDYMDFLPKFCRQSFMETGSAGFIVMKNKGAPENWDN